MTKKIKKYNKNKNKNTNKNNIKITINNSSNKRSKSRSQPAPKQGQPTIIYNNIPSNNNGHHELMQTLNTFKNDLDELRRVKISNFQNSNIPQNTTPLLSSNASITTPSLHSNSSLAYSINSISQSNQTNAHSIFSEPVSPISSLHKQIHSLTTQRHAFNKINIEPTQPILSTHRHSSNTFHIEPTQRNLSTHRYSSNTYHIIPPNNKESHSTQTEPRPPHIKSHNISIHMQ